MGKVCKRCLIYKHSDSFSLDSSSGDRLQKWCKNCTKEYRAENAERLKNQQKTNYLKNKEERLRKNREYYNRNREHIISQKAKYNANNPNVKRKSSSKRRASLEKVSVYEILDRDIKRLYRSPCIYCGSQDSIQIDHVMPISRGGTHSIGNIVPACKTCNPSKGGRTIMEWRKSKGFTHQPR